MPNDDNERKNKDSYFAQATDKSRTIDALILNKSSLVIPGLRGTPAGISTIEAPFNASPS